MTPEVKVYPRATLEEYGYKDYSKYTPLMNVLKKVLFFALMFMLYLSIVIIAIQSLNSSQITGEFGQFSLKWYPAILDNNELMLAIRNTLLVSGIATIIATIAGTFFAVGLYSIQKKNRQRWMLLNNVPILNADIVTGFSLMLMFKVVEQIIGIHIFGLFTLVMAHLFFTIPYVILSVMPKLKETDPNLMDAALDLGVRPYKALLKVVIPAIKAGIFSGALLALTMSIDDFVISYFNTGAGYDNLSIWIYSALKRLKPDAYAFSTFLTLFTLCSLVVYQLIQKHKERKEKQPQ